MGAEPNFFFPRTRTVQSTFTAPFPTSAHSRIPSLSSHCPPSCLLVSVTIPALLPLFLLHFWNLRASLLTFFPLFRCVIPAFFLPPSTNYFIFLSRSQPRSFHTHSLRFVYPVVPLFLSKLSYTFLLEKVGLLPFPLSHVDLLSQTAASSSPVFSPWCASFCFLFVSNTFREVPSVAQP